MFDVKSGDMIVVSGKGPVSCGIQLATLSIPNIGPLGRWGWAGASHVGIICNVFGEPLVYESTSFPRPPCVRTGRETPTGVQAHFLSDIVDAGGDVHHLPLHRKLYDDEEMRLLECLDSCLGQGYDFIGAARAGGGRLIRTIQKFTHKEDMNLVFCSEYVRWAMTQVGLDYAANASNWNPQKLVRHVLRRGIHTRGKCLSA